jgi:two-component system alkaline phosphatase synthesis response regulator PhoP
VDDEQDILEFVGYNLKKEGFQVLLAKNGKSAIELAKSIQPNLILLDVMMPEMDGIETCERIREIDELNRCIIVFLTARAEDYSQIAGFEAGGDDYITKPIRPKVLISRIHALLKRNSHTSDYEQNELQLKNLGNISIDIEKYVVTVEGNEIYLPKKEFSLLQLLTSKPSKVFTREEIFEFIWGNDIFVGDRTIDVYIRKLREKIGIDKIKTIKGVGYKFENKV